MQISSGITLRGLWQILKSLENHCSDLLIFTPTRDGFDVFFA